METQERMVKNIKRGSIFNLHENNIKHTTATDANINQPNQQNASSVEIVLQQ